MLTARRCLRGYCRKEFIPTHGRQKFCPEHRVGAHSPVARTPWPVTCKYCKKVFTTTDKRRTFCDKVCRAVMYGDRVPLSAGADPPPVPAPRRTAPPPPAARVEPWTMVEALAFVAQVADLRRTLPPWELAAHLDQNCLDRLVACLRNAADAEVLARKEPHRALRPDTRPAGGPSRLDEAQDLRTRDGPGDADPGPGRPQTDVPDGAGAVGPAGGRGRGSVLRPDYLGGPEEPPGPPRPRQEEADNLLRVGEGVT